MRITEFDFELPKSCIALRPAEPRESARLLCVNKDGQFDERRINDLIDLFEAGDVLVVNDTRVLPVQLSGTRRRDDHITSIEATLIKSLGSLRWQAFVKPGRRVKLGEIIDFGPAPHLKAKIIAKGDDGVFVLEFTEKDDVALIGRLKEIGYMPLPPYIRQLRREDDQDFKDYQTQFARLDGSVAAPTAGLHFTPNLIKALLAKGIQIEHVTLHVGAGTFLPVKVDDTDDHIMHAEYGEISPEVAHRLNKARALGHSITAVGTTSLRLLESACDQDGHIHSFADETAIFIRPGTKVKSVDALLTNFHLPKSTLFMLVCAFSGTETMKSAYDHAIKNGYRFFSYGDACLLRNRS